MMDKIREEFENGQVTEEKVFIENDIITAITRMLDNPKKNGAYLDHECTEELVIIFGKYWTKELLDAKGALMAMRALNKAALNNLKSRDEEIKKLRDALEDMVNYYEELNEYPSCIFLDTAKQALKDGE